MSDDVWLEWDRGWTVAHHDPPEWFTEEHLVRVPRPKVLLNQVITFHWSYETTLTGPVRRIQAWVKTPFMQFSPLRPEQVKECTEIFITAYANSHGRWFNEDKVIQITEAT